MNNPYCISVDWLEICGYNPYLEEGEYWINGKLYFLEKQDRATSFFKDYYVLKFKNQEYAYIRANPRLQRVGRSFLCLKLANRVLYHEDYIPLLWAILKALKIRYKGITRLDIAYDCNKFFNGRNPHRFVRDFVFKPMSEKGGMYLAGCREYSLHGRKSIGDDGSVNYISFGAKSSQKKGYIYNKSLELKEVKDKPWIRDMWERNGLKSDEKHNVWRAEISIKCEGKDLLNLETGQLFTLHPDYISTYENLKKVFHYYAAKVFDFRVNDGQKNRRNFSRLVLFDTGIEVTCLPKRVSNLCDSGRSEKACKNKLEKLSREYVDLSASVRHSLWCAIEFIDNLGSIKQAAYRQNQYKHYLDNFAATKFIDEADFAYMEACYEVQKSRERASRDDLYQRYIEYRSMIEEQDLY